MGAAANVRVNGSLRTGLGHETCTFYFVKCRERPSRGTFTIAPSATRTSTDHAFHELRMETGKVHANTCRKEIVTPRRRFFSFQICSLSIRRACETGIIVLMQVFRTAGSYFDRTVGKVWYFQLWSLRLFYGILGEISPKKSLYKWPYLRYRL